MQTRLNIKSINKQDQTAILKISNEKTSFEILVSYADIGMTVNILKSFLNEHQ